MNDKTKIHPPVTLDFDNRQIVFSDTKKLSKFMKEQRDAWSWIEEAFDRRSMLGETLSNEFYRSLTPAIDNFLTQRLHSLQDPERLAELSNELTQWVKHIVKRGFLLADDPRAIYVFELRDRETPQIAAYALALLINLDESLSDRPSAFQGAYLAMQYLQGSTETVAAQRKALDSLKQDWSEKIAEHDKEFREQNDRYNAATEAANEQNASQKTTFENTLKQIQEKFTNLERTYDQKLALQSPVRYWQNKRIYHQKVVVGMGFAVTVCSLTSLGVFIWLSTELLKGTLTEVPLSKLGIIFAISTFGIWLTRFLSKILVANLHMRADADERVTMITTSLAMLRKDKIIHEGDRHLILQTLFRPGSDGFVKEEGPTGFYEIIAKALQRKAP